MEGKIAKWHGTGFERQQPYALAQLEKLWNEYVATFACRWLVQGKWEWEKPEGRTVATRAERVKIKDHKTFIEFLKEKENG